MIGTLQTIKIIEHDLYDTLVANCYSNSLRMLLRADQCTCILNTSLLYYNPLNKYNKPNKVIELIQKSLKIADLVTDKNQSNQLFIDILERCVWFYEFNVVFCILI